MSGRIRSIKPEWREDKKIASLSHEAHRLLVDGVVLGADDYGNLRAEPGLLQAHAFWAQPNRTPIETLIMELVTAGMLELYTVRGQLYGRMPGWAKHQRVDKPGKPRCPAIDDEEAEPFPGFVRYSRDIRETPATDLDLDLDLDQGSGRGKGSDAAAPLASPATKKPPRQTPEPSTGALELADALIAAIRSHTPDHPAGAAARQRSAVDMDKLLNAGRTPEQVRRVIDRVHRHPDVFWRPKVLTGGQIAKRWSEFWVMAQQTSPHASGSAKPVPGYTARELAQGTQSIFNMGGHRDPTGN